MTTNTDDLIASLAEEGTAPQGSGAARFVLPLLAALAVCALAVSMVLDNAFAPYADTGPAPLLVKWAFSVSLVVLAPLALWLLGRPGRDARMMLFALAVPFAAVTAMFVADIAMAAPAFPGEAWQTCLTAMAILSPLAFIGAVLAVRQLAPTNLRRAGVVAGLFGGGVAMTAYAPFCPGSGMLYMVVFYCLPIFAMAALGYILGPKLLRW